MNSTGTLIQKIGSKRYVLIGSVDRKVYVRTYPALEPAGELNIHLPPWDDESGSRIWPNVLPLPEGYPSRYLALMMDRRVVHGSHVVFPIESVNPKAKVVSRGHEYNHCLIFLPTANS